MNECVVCDNYSCNGEYFKLPNGVGMGYVTNKNTLKRESDEEVWNRVHRKLLKPEEVKRGVKSAEWRADTRESRAGYAREYHKRSRDAALKDKVCQTCGGTDRLRITKYGIFCPSDHARHWMNLGRERT